MKKFLLLFTLIPAVIFASDFPKPQGPVNDLAHVINSKNRGQLTSLLTALEQQTGISFVIVTIPSLEGSDIETYAVKLYQEWGIGQRGTDKGLLILAAIQDRNARIEVGYGLEPYIPDAYAGRILRDVLFPYFKKGLYGEGFLETSFVLIDRLQEQLRFQLQTDIAPHQQFLNIPWPLKLLFFFIMLYLFIRHPLLFLFFFSGGGRGFGGDSRGGFGGGFGGFGGGLSGGGGASGRW